MCNKKTINRLNTSNNFGDILICENCHLDDETVSPVFPSTCNRLYKKCLTFHNHIKALHPDLNEILGNRLSCH